MRESTSNPLTSVLRYLLLACGLFYLALFLFTAINRIGYRFELEWVEGNSVDYVVRLLNGLPIYAQPGINFIANVYSPFYFYVSYVVCLFTGAGFLPLRLVSLVSTLGCLAIIWLWVKRESGDNLAAVLAACLFAAVYALAGAWFDLARTDILFVLLYLTSAYLLRFGRSYGSHLLAALFMFLSFFTKQGALFMLVPLFIYSLLAGWRKALVSIAAFALMMLASTLLFDQIYNGWYSYYVFYLPSKFSQELNWNNLIPFFTSELVFPLCIAIVLSILYLVFIKLEKRTTFWFYVIFLGAVLVEMVPGRLSRNAFVNHMIPLYAALSVTFGLGMSAVAGRMGGWKVTVRKVAMPLLYLLCTAQFAILIYDPFVFIPTKEDEAAGEHFLAVLRSLPDDVNVPAHSFVPTLAGKPSHAHTTCLYVVVVSDPGAVSQRLKEELSAITQQRSFPAYIMDARMNIPGYVATGTVFDRDDVFWTRSGDKTRPNYIYERR